MNWTWSLGECWCVVTKLVSLQKAGTLAGGGQGSGPPQMLSTGEGEHSKVSMKRTPGEALLMKETWSLARAGRASGSFGGMGRAGTDFPAPGANERMAPRE